jgi:hypothetical protein
MNRQYADRFAFFLFIAFALLASEAAIPETRRAKAGESI